ncbi:hypothetical protein TNCV_824801 [Trichonephila clavipes]|nr:hypothetical protein TNCV_824801 [Trichonephila clavipes]
MSLTYVHTYYPQDFYFEMRRLTPFILLPEETVFESTSHWLFCLIELLKEYICQNSWWLHVDDLVFADVEDALFLGIDPAVLH